MSDCTFRAKISVTPSSHEFWPSGGWHRTDNGWARFYACCDKTIVRRAKVRPRPGGGWEFKVSEITKRHVISVAKQPASVPASQPTQCIHAADLAAMQRYLELAHA
jgi:hypothetical protein